MGGVDKGLQLLDGRPLVSHLIERFAPEFAGRLAGLSTIPDDAWLLTAPCDCPRLPLDLAARLLEAARPLHG